jgi:hypothetical protein
VTRRDAIAILGFAVAVLGIASTAFMPPAYHFDDLIFLGIGLIAGSLTR